MNTWILIIVLFHSHSHGSAAAISAPEFSSLPACEAAQKAVLSMGRIIAAVCAKK